MNTGTTCRAVLNEEKKSAARDIVLRIYKAQGYDFSGETFKRYLDGRDSVTFGLFHGDTFYGTISVVSDSINGLPMDNIYSDELALWRTERKRFAEVIQLAVDHDLYTTRLKKKPSLFSAVPLFAATLLHAIEKDLEYLCILINPKHESFYSMIGFKQIGPRKQYASVGAPAVAYAFYVPEWRKHPILAGFFGKEILKHMPAQNE
jgi:hypothetical protein